MRLLAELGSLFLFVWFVGMIALTMHNISKTLFGCTFQNEPWVRFWMRQIMIVLWPLVMISEEGRYALYVIWTGKSDRPIPGREDLNDEE